MVSGVLPGAGAPSTRRYLLLSGVALLMVAAFVAYLPALNGEFVLDDDGLLTNNALVKAPNGLSRIWFTSEPVDYWPLSNTTLWFEWRLWGMNPTGYHVTNLLLHVAAALLIWAILRKLAIPGAFLAALLFAVHPVNVESVAWISQRKDALAIVFFLLSIWWYLRDEEARGADPAELQGNSNQRTDHGFSGVHRWYWLSLLAFLLAMLSKGSVATLPLLLLLIVWWRRGRIGMGDFARTIPFFLVAAVFTAVNLWFRTHGVDMVVRDIDFTQRLVGAGAAAWFYLSKALAPIHLIFSYPQWQIDSRMLLWWLPLVAAAVVTLCLAWKSASPRANWGRALLFAWLFFCVALAPMLGFTDVGSMQYSLVADHYQHIAVIAAVTLLAAAWSTWHTRSHAASRSLAIAAAITVVGLLTVLSWQQSSLYAGPVTLYEATIRENPGSWFARNNLGIIFGKQGRTEDAKRQFDEALRLKPDNATAHFNLGNLYRSTDRIQDAIAEYELALQLQPGYYDPRSNLGDVLLNSGRPKEAVEQFSELLKYHPNSATARFNLAVALSSLGKMPEAISQYNIAIKLRPDFAAAHNNLGFALASAGRLPEAIRHLDQAVRLQPNLAPAHRSLGFALAKAGRADESIAQYQQAIQLDPNHADDHYNLGNLLTDMGSFSEAVDQFKRALELKPDYAEAEGKLGLALLNSNQPQDALNHCKKAMELRPNDAEACANMALAYDQLHQPGEAIAAAEKAIEIARSQSQTESAKQIEAWLNSYRAQQAKPPASGQRSSRSSS